MKRILLLCAALMFAVGAFAQPTVPKPPTTVGSTTGVACEVWFYGETDVNMGEKDKEGNPVIYDGGEAGSRTPAVPMAKVKRNHDAWMKVLDAMSKEGENRKDKGPYTSIVGEYRQCVDDKGVKGGVVQMGFGEGSIEIRNVTWAGGNRIVRAALDQQAKILAMEEGEEKADRRQNDQKTTVDHRRGPRIDRDELGHRKPRKQDK